MGLQTSWLHNSQTNSNENTSPNRVAMQFRLCFSKFVPVGPGRGFIFEILALVRDMLQGPLIYLASFFQNSKLVRSGSRFWRETNIGSARDMWPGPLMYVAWFFQTSNQDLVWSSYVSKFWEFGTWYQEKSNKFNIKIDTSVFCIKLHATSAQAWHCLRPELWFLLDPFPLFWFVWAGHWAVLGLAVLPKVPPDPDGHSTVFLDFCKDLPRPKNPARDTCDFGLWWSGWKCIQKS